MQTDREECTIGDLARKIGHEGAGGKQIHRRRAAIPESGVLFAVGTAPAVTDFRNSQTAVEAAGRAWLLSGDSPDPSVPARTHETPGFDR
jgi:hypothetical protein